MRLGYVLGEGPLAHVLRDLRYELGEISPAADSLFREVVRRVRRSKGEYWLKQNSTVSWPDPFDEDGRLIETPPYAAPHTEQPQQPAN